MSARAVDLGVGLYGVVTMGFVERSRGNFFLKTLHVGEDSMKKDLRVSERTDHGQTYIYMVHLNETSDHYQSRPTQVQRDVDSLVQDRPDSVQSHEGAEPPERRLQHVPRHKRTSGEGRQQYSEINGGVTVGGRNAPSSCSSQRDF
jgi:hypothetical protein